MKLTAKWMIACFAASMAFGMVGCKGAPPEPPVAVGSSIVADNGAEISIAGFELTKPDFIDRDRNVFRPIADQAEVAVLRVKIRNTSGNDIKYKPIHYEKGEGRIQICTDPGIENSTEDNRVFVKAILLDSAKGIHSTTQRIDTNITIPAGGEIVDEYLFEPPTAAGKLIAIIPGAIVGVPKSAYFALSTPTVVEPEPPAALNQAVTVGGMQVTVKKVVKEYAELAPRTPPQTPLKYAYAYTETPVMSVYVSLKNVGSEQLSYNPSHNAEVSGISMLIGEVPVKRVKIASGAIGKNQIPAVIAIKPGDSFDDVFFFDAPATSSDLLFTLAGKIFGVNGAYRFALKYTPADPPLPDYEPYKNAPEGGDSAEAAEPVEAAEPADGAEPAADPAL